MERLRRFVPVPQVAVHAVKGVQVDTLQSTGQWKVLQVLIEDMAGHAIPPCMGKLIMERERFLVPEPQVAEQAPKAVQKEYLQSIGQAKEWQFSELEREGQVTPPCLTSVTMERDLVFEPVPQVLVHAL